MRTEEEREAMIAEIMESSIEAGEIIDQLDSLVEENEKLEKKLKAAREEIARMKEEMMNYRRKWTVHINNI
jgi:molecular chaperone GrpE (heat shock protein)